MTIKAKDLDKAIKKVLGSRPKPRQCEYIHVPNGDTHYFVEDRISSQFINEMLLGSVGVLRHMATVIIQSGLITKDSRDVKV